MTVLITLVIPPGGDVNNFNLYSDATGYSIPFATNISAATLTAGYTTSAVPNGTTIIRATSTGLCTNSIDMTVTLIPPPTTTTTSSSTSTTTSTSTSTSTTTSTSSTTTTTTTIYSPTCFVITLSTIDFANATGNDGSGLRIDNSINVKYRNNLGVEQLFNQPGPSPQVFNLCGKISNTALPHIYYYKNNVLMTASNSTMVFSGTACTTNGDCTS